MLPNEGFVRGNLALMVESFQGKNRLICAFREVARVIAAKHNLCADVDSILFVIDESREKIAKTASDIFNIPQLWRDVLFQMTLRRFDFLIKFVNVNIEAIRGNGKVFSALIYHELRHIKKSSKTGVLYLDKTHDIEDWQELLPFGDWEEQALTQKAANMENLPDLLKESIVRKEIA